MRLSAIARIAVPLFFLSSIANAELVIVGDEFQVNSYTVGQQFIGSVARGAAGGFIVTWTGLAQEDGSDNAILGQRFSSSATRIGGEFLINTFTQDSQGGPSIDSDAQGGFVVVWDSYYQDGGGYQGSFGQRFASNGQRVGTEFQVNSYTLGGQYDPAVAVTPSGSFVVAWESYDETAASQDGAYGGIFAQRFDSGGARVGSEFMVNTYTESVAFTASVVDAADGSFLIAWAGDGPDGLRIRGRLFDSAGQPTGPQFTVGEPSTKTQRSPTVAPLAGGGFIVAWMHDFGSFSEDILARRLDAAASPVGADFLVNTYTAGRQIAASAAATFDGGFAVAWQSPGDGSSDGVMVRLYDSAGVPKGAPTQMNVTTADRQNIPQLVETSPRNLVAAWSSNLQDGSFEGIFGIRLTPFGVPMAAKKLLIKNPAAGPTKNKLVFLSKDTTVEAPAGIAGDPRCAPLGSGTPAAGATLRVAGQGGDFTLDLPCLGWTANASKTKYSYRDATGTTCKTVKLQDASQLKAVCKGPQVAYTLGAAQGDVSVSLTLGETLQYCATFGAGTSADVKRDGSDGRTYKALNASAPTSCP
jgi:hypothetical protein